MTAAGRIDRDLVFCGGSSLHEGPVGVSPTGGRPDTGFPRPLAGDPSGQQEGGQEGSEDGWMDRRMWVVREKKSDRKIWRERGMSGRVGGKREGLKSEYLLWNVHKSPYIFSCMSLLKHFHV